MEIEAQNERGNTQGHASEEVLRSKSSLRLTYEAQVTVIRQQIGGLEGVRRRLGLSQRKMAQLLLVDPSAWTRWTKGVGDEAPPHIWRALQWYMALQEKVPGLTSQYFLSAHSQGAMDQWVAELTKQNEALKSTAGDLQERLRALEASQIQWRNRFLGLFLVSLGLMTLLWAWGSGR